MELPYKEGRITPDNVVDREGACEILKGMFVWSQRLSESLDNMHTFLHDQEGDPEDLMQRVLYCKSMIGLAWSCPFPIGDGMYELVAQSPLTTEN